MFLQLAEEHRRGGDLERAVAVLEQGLVKHPGYVSALVLLGRCRLEAGDPPAAIESLERAVVHDPAQLVANKLLVEAYLATGRSAQARERIEFYRLFNDRDPEIDELERRIDAAAPPVPSPAPSSPADIFDLAPASLPPLDLPIPSARGSATDAEPFGAVLDASDAVRRIDAAIAAEGIFPLALAAPAPVETSKPDFGDVFDLSASPVAAPPLGVAAWETEPQRSEEEPEPEAGQRPTAAAPSVVAEPEPPAAVAAEPAVPGSGVSTPPWGFRSGGRELELEAREQVVAEPFSPRSIGEEVERETIEEPFDEVLTGGGSATAMPMSDFASSPAEPATSEAAPPAPEVEVGPSSTLGELYLAQGHIDEAAAEFRRVLALRPDDAVARAGLDEIDRRRAPVEETASGWREGAAPAAPTGGLTQRKVATLRRYLDRLRRGKGRASVS